MSDPKYDGVRTTRKQLYDESEQEDDEDANPADNSDQDGAEDVSQGGTDEDEEMQSHATDDEDDIGSHSDSQVPPSRTQPIRNQVIEASAGLSRIDLGPSASPATAPDTPKPQDDIASNLRMTHEADKKKGRAVSRQIVRACVHLSNIAFSAKCRQSL